MRAEASDILSERALPEKLATSRTRRFLHFWVLVWRSFSKNRCPVRASALAYGTLLALIPMLAVVISITSSFLKKEGEDRIDEFVMHLVSSVTPPAVLSATNGPSSTASRLPANAENPTPVSNEVAQASAGTTNNAHASDREASGSDDIASLAQDKRAVAARKEIARDIHQFVKNTRSGALGVTGSVLLIFAAISLLSRIETTFNDIWGISRGRSWFMRIVLYWGVLSLAPLLLIVAVGLASGPHLESTRHLLEVMPVVGHLLFQFLPVVVLCLTFSLFYMLMPNTKVRWLAALVGGVTSGLLFHLNNMVSVLYVSRVISNSRIYGSLGLVPVFMVGLYFSWVILLFGAQVAYAFQNRSTYLEEKQIENINQRGREFVALRLMTFIGQRFSRGDAAPSAVELAETLAVPTRLIRQVLQTLASARLVAETTSAEPGYLPARPLETITCHDILMALRATQGNELATHDDRARNEVFGEFKRIEEAERVAASSVNLLTLANRCQEPAQLEDLQRRESSHA